MADPVQMGCLHSDTPLGPIAVAVQREALLAVSVGRDAAALQALYPEWEVAESADSPLLAEALHQLAAWLAGERRTLALPVDWSRLPEFQRAVLQKVAAIPWGETRSYGALARELGLRNGARAVGRANATNPLALVVPCHRVLGQDGSLTGYNAPQGVAAKRWLLALEGSWTRPMFV
jgi:methylated-DNA-[protein]-cysteine S-methyltransferase